MCNKIDGKSVQGSCQSPIITHFRENIKNVCQFYLTLKGGLKILPLDKISIDQLIAERGLRKDMIAEDLNITPSALSHKLKRRRRFKEEEIDRLSKILEVHPRIIRRSLGR